MLVGPRVATMRRSVNWCLCSRAGAGREPERKCRAAAGVLEWRRCSCCKVSLRWTAKTLTSAEERFRVARPLNSFGAENVFSTLRLPAGFPLWFLAIPQEMMENSDFLWADILATIEGKLDPEVVRSTPTCSACWDRGRMLPAIVRGAAACQYKADVSPFLV